MNQTILLHCVIGWNIIVIKKCCIYIHGEINLNSFSSKQWMIVWIPMASISNYRLLSEYQIECPYKHWSEYRIPHNTIILLYLSKSFKRNTQKRAEAENVKEPRCDTENLVIIIYKCLSLSDSRACSHNSASELHAMLHMCSCSSHPRISRWSVISIIFFVVITTTEVTGQLAQFNATVEH